MHPSILRARAALFRTKDIGQPPRMIVRRDFSDEWRERERARRLDEIEKAVAAIGREIEQLRARARARKRSNSEG